MLMRLNACLLVLLLLFMSMLNPPFSNQVCMWFLRACVRACRYCELLNSWKYYYERINFEKKWNERCNELKQTQQKKIQALPTSCGTAVVHCNFCSKSITMKGVCVRVWASVTACLLFVVSNLVREDVRSQTVADIFEGSHCFLRYLLTWQFRLLSFAKRRFCPCRTYCPNSCNSI